MEGHKSQINLIPTNNSLLNGRNKRFNSRCGTDSYIHLKKSIEFQLFILKIFFTSNPGLSFCIIFYSLFPTLIALNVTVTSEFYVMGFKVKIKDIQDILKDEFPLLTP